jgi:DNA-directed RNA polymerase II subunit RPB9
MASPASSAGDEAKKNTEQITFRFCSECSNMLYPKEDPDTHRLQFACRTCQYSEEAVSSCVFRNILNNAVGETAGVTQDVGSDPTVGLPFCLLCGSVVICEGRLEKRAAEVELHEGKNSARLQKL